MPAWTGRARSFLAFWSTFARTRVRDVTIEADRSAYRGPAFNVIVGNAQFASGGLRLSPRSFPGDGVLDVLVFKGPRSDAYTLLPRMYRHGDHIPDPHIHEMRARIRVSVDARRALPVVADGELLGTTPRTGSSMIGRPSRNMPFTTSWIVPSPPTATRKRRPPSIAAVARRVASPGPRVTCSEYSSPLAVSPRSSADNSRPTRPRPAFGFAITARAPNGLAVMAAS